MNMLSKLLSKHNQALFLGVITMAALLLTTTPVHALSGGQFSAGDIIDDSVFNNTGTMSANDIQNFLNSKVPVCDTNGTQMYNSTETRAQYSATQGYSPPFTCLKDYTMAVPTVAASPNNCAAIAAGTESSAQIIYNISQACGINPQVLITLLQKEQGLVTDTWPWSIEYQSATGYGCPDSSACNTSYYGLFNQLYNSALAFKEYGNNPSNYNYVAGQNNSILYNPNRSCGSSNVFIENQPTADMYIYTPYQPDQAALNNLYGSGDSCSSYGNRDFWQYFNNWFGPSVGPLVRTATSPDLYYSDGQTIYHVSSMDLANEYGLGLSDVRIISQAAMNALTLSTQSPYLTDVMKSTSDTDADGGDIYLVTEGERYLIPSMSLFSDYGFTTSELTYLDYSQLLRLPLAGTLTNFVKDSSTGTVYNISSDAKNAIFDYSTFSQVDPSGSAQSVDPFVLNQIPTGTAIVDSTLVLQDPNGGIWFVDNNTWNYVSSMTAYGCLGLASLPNIPFTSGQSNIGTQGPNASCVVQGATSGNQYILDGWRRIPVNTNWGFTSFFTVPDSFLSNFSVYNPTSQPVFRSSANGPLYILSGGKKRQIYSMSSFYQRGYTSNDLFTTTTDFLSTIPTGTPAFADGTIIQDSSTGKLYIVSNDGLYYIPSMTIFNAYGFSTANMVSLDPTTISEYSNLGTISSQLAYTPNATVFDSGIALQIPQSLTSAFGFSTNTQPTYPAAIAASGSVRTATPYLLFGNSPTLYYMQNGMKDPVYSWDTFVSLGGSNNNITALSASAANLWPTGPNM